ncbi:MAG: U32 family peptidase [Clostridia bacterium]|nr:U32 family peptidase [Clostridia bacterium]
MEKPELLAPAGSLNKLKIALYYGADAVYLGGKQFSLRSFADNFTAEELKEGVSYAHAHGKKVYVCANIFAKNTDFAALEDYFAQLQALDVDAVLISDPGVLRVCRKVAPRLPVHISTQANTLNAQSAAFWREAGAERVVLARELSLKEIAEIHAYNPDLELEAFVHGAMCISYSGRCYLSDYLDGRQSNRGACVQACRWKYRIQSDEGKRGEWYELEEDEKGAYIMNSKDLNMSAHLNELREAGVRSFKIEGRMKSEYYLATVVNAYRRILDGADPVLLGEELECAAHRDYTTAYAFGSNADTISPENSQTKGTCEYIANVLAWENGRATVEMRNRFRAGDVLEILSPSGSFGKSVSVNDLKDSTGAPCEDAKLVQGKYSFACSEPLSAGDILRRRR